MDNEVGGGVSVAGGWIEAIEGMKKQKNPFAHLVADSVESEIKAQNRDCPKDDCCGNC